MSFEDRPLEPEHKERLISMLQKAFTNLPESRSRMSIWETWRHAVSDLKPMPEYLLETYMWALPRLERGAWERETGRMGHEVEVLRIVRDVVSQALQPGVPDDWPEYPGAPARVLGWRPNGDLRGEVQLELRDIPEGETEKPWIWVPGNRLTLPWDAAPAPQAADQPKV